MRTSFLEPAVDAEAAIGEALDRIAALDRDSQASAAAGAPTEETSQGAAAADRRPCPNRMRLTRRDARAGRWVLLPLRSTGR